MHEIKAVERMTRILDAAIHVHAAFLAGVPLNRGRLVDDRELAAIRRDAQIVPRNDRDK